MSRLEPVQRRVRSVCTVCATGESEALQVWYTTSNEGIAVAGNQRGEHGESRKSVTIGPESRSAQSMQAKIAKQAGMRMSQIPVVF